MIRPSSFSQGTGPDADASEEMTLCIAVEVRWHDITNVARVHISEGDFAGGDEVSQELGSIGVDLVVIGAGGCRHWSKMGVSQRHA